MYRIGKDGRGTTLVCRACAHTERIQALNGSVENPRTLAAQAMLKHVHTNHSRETHLRAMAMAMVMERRMRLDSLPHLEKKSDQRRTCL